MNKQTSLSDQDKILIIGHHPFRLIKRGLIVPFLLIIGLEVGSLSILYFGHNTALDKKIVGIEKALKEGPVAAFTKRTFSNVTIKGSMLSPFNEMIYDLESPEFETKDHKVSIFVSRWHADRIQKELASKTVSLYVSETEPSKILVLTPKDLLEDTRRQRDDTFFRITQLFNMFSGISLDDVTFDSKDKELMGLGAVMVLLAVGVYTLHFRRYYHRLNTWEKNFTPDLVKEDNVHVFVPAPKGSKLIHPQLGEVYSVKGKKDVLVVINGGKKKNSHEGHLVTLKDQHYFVPKKKKAA